MRAIFLCFIVIVFISESSCKKDAFNGISKSYPAVPVTVTNLFGMYNGVPTVSTSLSGGGSIMINLSIPAGTGRTIKEITRVAVASTPNNYRVVSTGTGLYNAAPIAANGLSASFSTSLSEFTSKTGIAVLASGTATSFLSRYFIFLVTLDNGEQVLPVGVRVYIAS